MGRIVALLSPMGTILTRRCTPLHTVLKADLPDIGRLRAPLTLPQPPLVPVGCASEETGLNWSYAN